MAVGRGVRGHLLAAEVVESREQADERGMLDWRELGAEVEQYVMAYDRAGRFGRSRRRREATRLSILVGPSGSRRVPRE